jgi:hypothetical protein
MIVPAAGLKLVTEALKRLVGGFQVHGTVGDDVTFELIAA